MPTRLIFEDMFAFVFNKGRKSLYWGRKYYLNGILTQYSMSMNRKICTSSSGIGSTGNQFSLSPPLPVVHLRRLYQRDNNPVSNQTKVWRKRLWRVVRGIFLATGGFVWAVAFFAYLSLEKVNVDILDERAGGSGLNVLERKLMNHFYKEKNEAGILKKDDALDRVWRKLNQEERVKEIFGNPVYICGYNYSNKIGDLFDQVEDSTNKLTKGVGFEEGKPKGTEHVEESEKEEEHIEKGNESEVEDGKIWEAGCYIEGSKKVGLLTVKFEEYEREWVPVALHLETMEKSGQVISDVSASLPNGLKNFTRLSN